jgi:hypothetical protein
MPRDALAPALAGNPDRLGDRSVEQERALESRLGK